jgi:glycine cleavage system T protein
MNADLMRSPLADYHVSQGATLAEYHGALVPSRFTDPFQEHLAVRAAAGIFDFSFRAKFELAGRDAQKFLHRIVSNDINRLSAGEGTYATLLNPQGQILADLRVYATQDRLLVDTDADLRAKAMAILRRYIIGDRVQAEPLETCALAFEGPKATGLLEKTLHEDLPAMKEFDHFATNYAGFPVRVVRMSNTGEEGYEVWAAPKAMMGLWGAACGQAPSYDMLPCGTEALESLRIEAGIPRYGSELGEDTLPLEANLMNALSFNKGCYIGQEIVERARSRGHVNWKLAGVIVEGGQTPAPGDKLTFDGKEVAEVTSACVSPSLQKTIALAYIRKEHLDAGTRLQTAYGAVAEVATLPFYPSPASAPVE